MPYATEHCSLPVTKACTLSESFRKLAAATEQKAWLHVHFVSRVDKDICVM